MPGPEGGRPNSSRLKPDGLAEGFPDAPGRYASAVQVVSLKIKEGAFKRFSGAAQNSGGAAAFAAKPLMRSAGTGGALRRCPSGAPPPCSGLCPGQGGGRSAETWPANRKQLFAQSPNCSAKVPDVVVKRANQPGCRSLSNRSGSLPSLTSSSPSPAPRRQKPL